MKIKLFPLALTGLLLLSIVYAQQKSSGHKIIHARNSKAPAGVKLNILEPREGEVVAGPDVTVKFTIENWKLYKEGEHGQHLHIILDNQPYEAHYSTDPFVFKNVPPGPHVVRAFPGRPWHESVKQPAAFAMVQFYVNEKSGEPLVDASKPMLIYSRPKGEYSLSNPPPGQPEKGILLDWYIHNFSMAGKTGYDVRSTVDGMSHVFKEWRPHYIQGLEPGEHTFKIELLKDGKPMEGNFNTTERRITILP